MIVRNLDDVKEHLGSLSGTFAGVGMTAFSRITPAYLLAPYRIVSLRKTLDLCLLRAKADIFCLEEETGEPAGGKGFNSARLLAHPLAQQFLENLPEPKHLLLYQNYPDLMELGKNKGWRLLGNPADLRIRVGERGFFKKMVTALGLPVVPGGIHPIETIHVRGYDLWAKELGSQFVVQLPEIIQGGGRGTFFIRSAREYEGLRVLLKENLWRGVGLSTVAVNRFLRGIPASVAMCLTRHGVLASRLQRQLVDLPYCEGFSEDGIFCGHVWDETPWPFRAVERAAAQADLIGRYLWALGYKGILGVDFLVDEEKEQIIPLEINPRFTGAFPMLSLLYLKEGKIPLEAFHMLEFMDAPYEINTASLNKEYAKPVKGSHLLLFFREGDKQPSTGRLRAGLHENNPREKKVLFVGECMDYEDLENNNQFIVIDGPLAFPGSPDPPHRFCRVLFPCPVVDDSGVLSPHASSVIKWIYSRLDTHGPKTL